MGCLTSVHVANGSNGEKEWMFQLQDLERTKISFLFMYIYTYLSAYSAVKFGEQSKLLFHVTILSVILCVTYKMWMFKSVRYWSLRQLVLMEAGLGNWTPLSQLPSIWLQCLSPSHRAGSRKHIAGLLNHMQIPFMCTSCQSRLRDLTVQILLVSIGAGWLSPLS